MILSDAEIEAAVQAGRIELRPYTHAQLQPSSYDLTLAGELILFEGDTERLVKFSDEYTLPPWQFALGTTIERVGIPADLAARLEGKSSMGRLGLAIHATAGFIDPGFTGELTLEITNLSGRPVKLRAGQTISQISFLQMNQAARRPYGSPGLGSHYQGQAGPTVSRR